MAVEANLKLFSPQLIPNGEIMTIPTDATMMNNMYNNYYASTLPLSGTTTGSENLVLPAPEYFAADSIYQNQKTPVIKSNSTLTYNNNIVPATRKRSRETMNSYMMPSSPYYSNFSFMGEDISLNIYNQQMDTNNLISQHMEKVRAELEEKRKRQAKWLADAMEIGIIKRLKTKEEELERMVRLNMILEERAKSLSIESQLWRDLAKTNEATAISLRTNLEQVMSQLNHHQEEEEAESCCGSNDDEVRVRTIGPNGAQDKGSGCTDKSRLCRKCGKDESCVLILPCRHLCLCTHCGSMVNTCPICQCVKNASVHVNMC